MSLLLDRYRKHFQQGDISRGNEYFECRNVGEIAEVNPNEVLAEVDGSYGTYEVKLNLRDPFKSSCECPRFADGFFCKHIWAALKQYEASFGEYTERNTERNDVPEWMHVIGNISEPAYVAAQKKNFSSDKTEKETRLLYVIDVSEEELMIAVLQQQKKSSGEWGVGSFHSISTDTIHRLADPVDRQIVGALIGSGKRAHDLFAGRFDSFARFSVTPFLQTTTLDALVKSERFFWGLDSVDIDGFYPIVGHEFQREYQIEMELEEIKRPKDATQIEVALRCGNRRIDNSKIVYISNAGVVLAESKLYRINNPELIPIWERIYHTEKLIVKKKERDAFIEHVFSLSGAINIHTPSSWDIKHVKNVKPKGILKLSHDAQDPSYLTCSPAFEYGNHEVPFQHESLIIHEPEKSRLIHRNSRLEKELLNELNSLPIFKRYHNQDNVLGHLAEKHLLETLDALAEQNWTVLLEEKPFHKTTSFDVAIESDQDWFDLKGVVNFHGQTIALPELLQAARSKQKFVKLADGSHGRIPIDELEKYMRLSEFGRVEGDSIRFQPSQAMLLDAMLGAKNDVKFDAKFKQIRKQIQSFKGIKPKTPPKTFKGELREYQSAGLGWLHFLQKFGFGGCLADDMGLGKTIQVLSLLDTRRTRTPDQIQPKTKRNSKSKATKNSPKKQQADAPIIAVNAKSQPRKPSIVVVPKSLIFNWIDEAAKFTPNLKILNYTGTDRQSRAGQGGFDILLTTYGTLRKDIEDLSQIDFDYAILDESQAIKNSKALSSKACRILKADHRLAMTGTPIENHLGELWSLFEFLNPGMLGSSRKFSSLTRNSKKNETSREKTLKALSNSLKPFLLRRTKDQVLKDLPEKTEQTLYCDMLPAQKKKYKELKEYYRVKLKKRIETQGLAKSKIQVLEALLRLRQAACDPRLIDTKQKCGAKLELLEQQLSEVTAEGHKVLVFSQFTKMLSLVKKQLTKAKIPYEYLDGKTANRKQAVKRFQESDDVSIFLISLKAGGHGLNLTSADYVYLLDPWWNPAVEAQAIDRAHRMGQQNPVIAYRMICRDTVEEKIVDLQQSKRDLADSIIRADESLIKRLTADDLQALLQ